jgi:hypothetical protein
MATQMIMALLVMAAIIGSATAFVRKGLDTGNKAYNTIVEGSDFSMICPLPENTRASTVIWHRGKMDLFTIDGKDFYKWTSMFC